MALMQIFQIFKEHRPKGRGLLRFQYVLFNLGKILNFNPFKCNFRALLQWFSKNIKSKVASKKVWNLTLNDDHWPKGECTRFKVLNVLIFNFIVFGTDRHTADR